MLITTARSANNPTETGQTKTGKEPNGKQDNVEAVYPDLAYFNEVDKGGRFAAWEEPQLFAEEMRAAFSSLR